MTSPSGAQHGQFPPPPLTPTSSIISPPRVRLSRCSTPVRTRQDPTMPPLQTLSPTFLGRGLADDPMLAADTPNQSSAAPHHHHPLPLPPTPPSSAPPQSAQQPRPTALHIPKNRSSSTLVSQNSSSASLRADGEQLSRARLSIDAGSGSEAYDNLTRCVTCTFLLLRRSPSFLVKAEVGYSERRSESGSEFGTCWDKIQVIRG